MKKEKQPTGLLRLSIQLAQNGIILTDRDNEEFFMVESDNEVSCDHEERKSRIHRLIGSTIYEWLEVAMIDEHERTWYITGAELDINVRLTGQSIESLILQSKEQENKDR